MDNADVYNNASSIQMCDAIATIEEYREKLRWSRGETVLDIGCGPGTVTSQIILPILPEDATIVGCDVSQSMVEYANVKFGGARLKFKQMDIGSLDVLDQWQEGTFDKIFSFYCLHWVQQQQLAVNNINKLLKPDGSILLMFVGTNPVFTLYERMAVMPKWKPYMKNIEKFQSPYHKSQNASAEFADILGKAKFVDIYSSQKDGSHLFKTFVPMMKAVEAVNPFIKNIPKDMLNEYKSDMLKILTEQKLVTVKDDGIHVDYKLIVATARKARTAAW